MSIMMESENWAEAELSHLQDIPVAIIQGGEKTAEGNIEIEVVVHRAGDAHFVTARELKEIILREKVPESPDQMRENSDSCRMIICQGQEIAVIPDVERIRKYGRALAQDNSILVIADNADMDEGSATTQIRQAFKM